MKVGDLVKLKTRLGEPVGIVTEDGPAASSGILWWVVFGKKKEPVFEDDLEVLSASR